MNLSCSNLDTILIFIKLKMKKTSQFAWKKEYILPNFKLQFSHNIFPHVSVCQNSDEIKATDLHNIRMSFFVVVSLYIFTDRNKPQKMSLRNHSWFFEPTCKTLESLLIENINDTFLFLISNLDLLVVHRPNNDLNYLIGEGRHASLIWNFGHLFDMSPKMHPCNMQHSLILKLRPSLIYRTIS